MSLSCSPSSPGDNLIYVVGCRSTRLNVAVVVDKTALKRFATLIQLQVRTCFVEAVPRVTLTTCSKAREHMHNL